MAHYRIGWILRRTFRKHAISLKLNIDLFVIVANIYITFDSLHTVIAAGVCNIVVSFPNLTLSNLIIFVNLAIFLLFWIFISKESYHLDDERGYGYRE